MGQKREGDLASMVDAAGTTGNTGDSAGFLQTEGGLWPNDAVTITHTNQLRAGLSPPGGTWNQAHGYDSAKRLKTGGSPASPSGPFTYWYPRPPGVVSGPAVDLIELLIRKAHACVIHGKTMLGT